MFILIFVNLRLINKVYFDIFLKILGRYSNFEFYIIMHRYNLNLEEYKWFIILIQSLKLWSNNWTNIKYYYLNDINDIFELPQYFIKINRFRKIKHILFDAVFICMLLSKLLNVLKKNMFLKITERCPTFLHIGIYCYLFNFF